MSISIHTFFLSLTPTPCTHVCCIISNYNYTLPSQSNSHPICADLTFALYAFFHHILKSRITMFIEWYHGSALPQSNVPCLKHERSQKRLNKVVLRYSMPTLFLSPHRFVLSCYRHFAKNNAKISVKRSIQCWLSCWNQHQTTIWTYW